MKVFVTGGSGFIGRRVVRLLDGHDVLVLSRSGTTLPGATTVVGDLDTPVEWSGTVRSFSPELCIHLAWRDIPDYSVTTCIANVNASLQLFQLLAEIRCQRVFAAGTCWEYGAVQGAVSEADEPGPRRVFPAAKRAVQELASAILADAEVPLVWGRLFFVYGPGQRDASLIPSCYNALAAGDVPDLRTPDAVNDFVHVDDVARAIVALTFSSSAVGVYNIGSGVPSHVGRVVNTIAARLGAPPPCVLKATPADNGFWANLTRLRSAIDWRPEIDVEQGVSQMVDALRANG